MTAHRVIVGVGGTLGHDANAALFVDGRLVAASQEERYSRKKYDPAFPEQAIRDCLAFVDGTLADVDVCVFADKPLQEWLSNVSGRPSNWLTWQLGRMVSPSSLESVVRARELMPRAALRFAWHHLAHAALAFATSPYERAAFLCVDGRGDDVNATIGVADARRTEITYELPYEHGVGFMYTLVTEVLGYSLGSEYKVMGLAPYGRPVMLERLRAFAQSDDNGALRFNEDHRAPWAEVVKGLAAHLGMRPRHPREVITDQHADLAASIQVLFEEQIFRMAGFAKRVTGERYLLFCGGCAQNCVAAGKLRGLQLFDGVFASPAAGDVGTGLGAAVLYRQHTQQVGDGKIDVSGLRLGSSPGELPPEAFGYKVAHDDDTVSTAARLLAEGNVIGWVRGRMELGARALGARSIFADPRVPSMQSTLNQKIKFRESFRPFAPAILAEDCGEWFDSIESSDFMQSTAWLRLEHRSAPPQDVASWRERLHHRRCEFPAVVHVDFSSRLQTVRREQHPDLHQLLTEFKRRTGCPLLVNTSFNVSGQPIVRTAADAWETFRHTAIDYLVIDNVLLRNPNDRTAEESRTWRMQFEESN